MKMENTSIGNYRWRICALLFLATTINYIDRQVIGILAPTLQATFQWSEIDYGNIVTAFQTAYAIGMVSVGGILDKIGVKLGFSIAIIAWSLAGMGHALARGVLGFAIARFSLGLGEAANFPACVKTISEWFPKKERALATGIFNSGSNIGAILAPIIVPYLAVNYGWESAFIVTGLLGFVWLFFWIAFYQKPAHHPRLSKKELAYIHADGELTPQSLAWSAILPYRQTWTLCLMRFMTDPVWWFFLFWLPKFLNSHYQLDMKEMSKFLIIVYVVADVGSILGGWLSSYLITKGKSIDFSRKATLLVCVLGVMPVVLATQVGNLWVSVGLISLAAAAYQGWSANIFTLVSDIYPKNAVGSVAGLIGTCGAIGGVVFSSIIGRVLESTGNYLLLFTAAAFLFLFAWSILKLSIKEIKEISLVK
jgi:ACS family hexuronate transporter-like MFS transporter